MSNELPPLPEPRTLSRGDEDGAIQLGYTADQMRAYAAAAVAAERERWESAIGAEMLAGFKDWHQNSTTERPTVAAWVIRNLREREAEASAAERELFSRWQTARHAMLCANADGAEREGDIERAKTLREAAAWL